MTKSKIALIGLGLALGVISHVNAAEIGIQTDVIEIVTTDSTVVIVETTSIAVGAPAEYPVFKKLHKKPLNIDQIGKDVFLAVGKDKATKMEFGKFLAKNMPTLNKLMEAICYFAGDEFSEKIHNLAIERIQAEKNGTLLPCFRLGEDFEDTLGIVELLACKEEVYRRLSVAEMATLEAFLKTHVGKIIKEALYKHLDAALIRAVSAVFNLDEATEARGTQTV